MAGNIRAAVRGSRPRAVGLAVGLSLALLTGCSSDNTPNANSPTPSTDPPRSELAAPVIEVDPADYAVGAGTYRWRFEEADSFPARECSIFPLRETGHGVRCIVPITTPLAHTTVEGGPNAISLTSAGVENAIAVPEPGISKMLHTNTRITIGDVTCTSLPQATIHCVKDTDAFIYTDGTLTVSDADAATGTPISVPPTG